MNKLINILIVEDDEDDYILTRDLLAEAFGNEFQITWVTTWDGALESLYRDGYDVCLVDYHLGERTGLELVRASVDRGTTTPFIMLTGQNSHEVDREASRAGAADYLIKGQITAPLLERAIRYALERKKTEEYLTKLAQNDPLTGIANRALVEARLAEAIAQSKRTKGIGAVLLLDLDHFKEINDQFGHPVGDAFLIEVADRLKRFTRETDTVGRMGGDEFVIVATNLTHMQGAGVLAQKIIDALGAPFALDDQEVGGGASIGIALFPQDDSVPAELFRDADLALYQAKNHQRGTFAFYNREMNRRARAQKSLESELRHAISDGQLSLHFQPIFNARDGAVESVEALPFWHRPDHGPVPPADLLAMAQKVGLMAPLGEMVVAMTCASTIDWKEFGTPSIPLALSIIPLRFRPEAITDALIRIVSDSGANPASLIFGFTERSVIGHMEELKPGLRRLRDMGAGLLVNDFGYDNAPIAPFVRLPFDKLRIAAGFVEEIAQSPARMEIAKSIVSLGKSLDVTVIADGVTSETQLSLLAQAKVGGLQGSLLCPPLPVDAFMEWWSTYQTGRAPGRPMRYGD